MKFNDATEVEQLAYQIRLADYPRGQNRARIQELFNGFPPFTDQEVQENQITVNVNFLESTRQAHDARSQYGNVFLKPGRFFRAKTDYGPKHKRSRYSTIFESNINRVMKRSLSYMECFRSKFALDILHGIGPSVWPDQDNWCPDPAGIDDIGIPARTYLHMKNLPFFYVYRSFTAPELMKLTRGPNVDPGWNIPLVNRCLEWIDRETMQLMGSNWPEVWAPEKASERVKGDGGFYVGDQVPTLDCFDFYFYSDEGKEAGWRRRILLDSWGTPATLGGTFSMSRKEGDPFNRGEFLYNGGERVFAERRENIIAFQFADLSAAAPFQYHSVRSLGFLLFALCHLQNRLRCRMNEATFEALMMYFRVKSADDVQRALKVDLVNRGVIDDSVSFVPNDERFQVNAGLVELGIKQNSQLIMDNASSYTQAQNYSQGGTEKTKFQVMAEMNSMQSLVSAGLNQAYAYQNYEYYEIVRRFCRRNSGNIDVRQFQADCMRQGLPEQFFDSSVWEIEAERVMGAGNKTLEMAIANQLMEWRPMFDPEPQREILRDAVLAMTDDAGRADSLVPESPVKVTDSVHDAQLAAGVLMSGLPVGIKTGINHIEYVEAMLLSLSVEIARAKQSGGMATAEKIQGMQNVAQHVAQHIQIIGQDKTEKARVKQYSDQLAKLMNEVKAFAQRLQEAMKQQAQSQGGGIDPKDAAEIQATILTAKTKADIAKEAHAQRTAQRQIQFEQQLKQQSMRSNVEVAATDLRTAAQIKRERAQAKAQKASSQEGENA